MKRGILAYAMLAAGACVVLLAGAACRQALARSADVLPEYNNQTVTELVEDCEWLRLPVGAAWDDALDCRALSGYARPWTWGDVVWHYDDGTSVVYPAYDKVDWTKE